MESPSPRLPQSPAELRQQVRQPLIKPQDKRFPNLYPIMVAAVLFLMAIELPYRPIHIPKPVMVTMGLLSFIGIAFLSFENYFLALLLLVSYMPFSSILPGDFGGFLTAFNLTNILTLVIVVGWMARGSFRGEPFYQRTRVDFLLAVFCALASLSMIQGAIEGALADHIVFSLKRYLTPFFFYYIYANNIRQRKEVEYIFVTVCFVTFIPAVMALKESYIDIGSFGSWDKMRVKGIANQPNDLAAYFSYYSPFLIAPLLYEYRNKRYWPLAFGAFVSFWATTRTFSRGGLIAYLVGLFITLWIRSWKLALTYLVGLVLFVTVFHQYLPESVVGRFSSTIQKPKHVESADDGDSEVMDNPESLDKSSAKRVEIWQLSLPYIKAYPFFGIGYGMFDRIIGADAHNGFILICTEMGIPALLIYLAILWRLGRSARYLHRYGSTRLVRWLGHGYLASVWAVVVANQFGSRLNSQELSSLFWILGGIVMMIERRMRTRSDSEFETTEPPPVVQPRVSGLVPHSR